MLGGKKPKHEMPKQKPEKSFEGTISEYEKNKIQTPTQQLRSMFMAFSGEIN